MPFVRSAQREAPSIPPKAATYAKGATFPGLQKSLERVTLVSNTVSGFERVGADFSPSEANFGNAMANLMRDQDRVGKLGGRYTPGGPEWKAGVIAALRPYAKDLATALDTGRMGRPPSTDSAPGTMADQVVQLVPFLTTKPMLVLRDMADNSEKYDMATDPAAKEKYLTALQNNARELKTNLAGAEKKLEICGKVLTDPKVLATLPAATRNLTLEYGQGLLKMGAAYREPGGIVANMGQMADTILLSRESARQTAVKIAVENMGPLPEPPTESARNSRVLPRASTTLPAANGNAVGTLPAKP